MTPFRYKPEAPHGSPNHDGEAAPCKSYEELYCEYCDHVKEELRERSEPDEQSYMYHGRKWKR